MSSIVLSGDTSGTVTVAVPAVAGTNTVTIAAQTGTLNAAGPAFSAYSTSNQTGIASATFTKMQFTSEFFDTNNCFDSTTNYRFTPNVAGYYQVNGNLCTETSSVVTRTFIALYKNGSAILRGGDLLGGNAVSLGTVIYLNGSTDYIELYGYAVGTGLVFRFQDNSSSFSAALVRGA